MSAETSAHTSSVPTPAASSHGHAAGHSAGLGGILHQPKAVWAVAFASVIAFMGIGLVDPILPSIATNLNASHSQVELLFTSYFAVMAIAMLGTGWVSSRIGVKKTLLGGLALVVLFASLAGTSGTVLDLEDRIAWFDAMLSQAPAAGVPAAERAALQSGRTAMVDSLQRVRYAQTLLAY